VPGKQYLRNKLERLSVASLSTLV